MKKLNMIVGVVVSSGVLVAAACSDSTAPTPDAGSTSSSGSSSGGSSSGASSSSGAPASVNLNGCAEAADAGITYAPMGSPDGGGLEILWDFDLAPFNIPAPLCWTVKVGTSITFKPLSNGTTPATFALHPLVAKGGDATGNPFPTTPDSSAVSSKTYLFNTPGTFGYLCANHPTMIGVVQVVP